MRKIRERKGGWKQGRESGIDICTSAFFSNTTPNKANILKNNNKNNAMAKAKIQNAIAASLKVLGYKQTLLDSQVKMEFIG